MLSLVFFTNPSGGSNETLPYKYSNKYILLFKTPYQSQVKSMSRLTAQRATLRSAH
jgi:hypothetical protein